jgi:transposase
MTAARKRFSQEFKDELCQEVIATSKPIREVAEAYSVGTETLRKWLNKYRHTHGGTETELTVSERARLKELEREGALDDESASANWIREQNPNRSITLTPGDCARTNRDRYPAKHQ